MITAKGTNGTIHFDGQTIVLERSGFGARMSVGKGEKRIPLASVTAVQWRKAGLTTGFIQFTLAGGVERRSRPGHSGGDARTDENSVTFHSRQQAAFEEVRAAIDGAIEQRHVPQPTAAAPASIADELGKLAALRDQGVISAQDFEAGKARILAG